VESAKGALVSSPIGKYSINFMYVESYESDRLSPDTFFSFDHGIIKRTGGDTHNGPIGVISGSDKPGFQDGDFQTEARYRGPIGIVRKDGMMLVADTFNNRV